MTLKPQFFRVTLDFTSSFEQASKTWYSTYCNKCVDTLLTKLLVLDKNDWAPLALEYESIYLNENTEIGTKIGQVSATDFDSTSSVSYVLLGEGNRSFHLFSLFATYSDSRLIFNTFNRVINE